MEQIIINLHRLIDKKVEYFKELMLITDKQKIDIDTNIAENIGELVNQKQIVIDKIDEIDKAFKQQSDLLKKSMGIDSFEVADVKRYPELAELKIKVNKIVSMANQIMVMEKENYEKLNTMFNAVKSELKRLNTGKKSLKAYETKSMNVDGIYIDKKK